jgi:hypothetical protein
MNFLIHSKNHVATGKWHEKSKPKETYDAFVKSFEGFINLCSLDQLDGRWIGQIVDHMCSLLLKYAEDADKEPISSSLNQLTQPDNMDKITA